MSSFAARRRGTAPFALLGGGSKESVSMALGILRKKRLAVVGADRMVRLTPIGREKQEAYRRLLAIIEERWLERFGGVPDGS